MTHFDFTKLLSDRILILCAPIRARLNAGIVAHALIFSAVRLMMTFASTKVPHISEENAGTVFGELMLEINKLVVTKFRKLGVPMELVDECDDISEPPINLSGRN